MAKKTTEEFKNEVFLKYGNEFPVLGEYHHKALVVAATQKEAITSIKQSEFYQNRGYAGAESHIDDKMSVDIDDVHIVDALLAGSGWHLHITPSAESAAEDVWQVGYLSLSKLAKRVSSLEA